MPLDLSTKSFPITCPKCGYKSQKTLAWLQNNLEFNCSGCGNLIRADRANISQAISDLEKAEQRINDSLRSVGDALKRRR